MTSREQECEGQGVSTEEPHPRTAPNIGVQATAYSLRFASASSRA
jgi:hypothetical protein